MGSFIDTLPMSGIVRIRDMMYTVKNPFRLDQGDVSFDAPEGKIKFHAKNHHLFKHARIGAFRKDGQIDMIYESPLIEPNPFPKF